MTTHEITIKNAIATITIRTQDITELSEADWFRQIVLPNGGSEIHQSTSGSDEVRGNSPLVSPDFGQRPSIATPRPQPTHPLQRPQPVPDFMQINPNEMSEQMWNSLTDAQKQQWMRAYGIAA